MMNPSGNTILVTGGTSGIGRELAIRWHQAGNTVIVAGRRQSLIDELTAGHPGMTGYAIDLTDAVALEAFVARLLAEHPDLDVLVNNAGMMREEDWTAEPVDLTAFDATIAANLVAPVRLTAALLPHLRGRPRATIVTVTSGLAFVPLAKTISYNATKAALHSWTQSLRYQLRGTAIECLELIPPAVQTDLVPGHADDPAAMPLQPFIDEVMALFARQPTPTEIRVERVAPLRDAEANGRFDTIFATLNANHR